MCIVNNQQKEQQQEQNTDDVNTYMNKHTEINLANQPDLMECTLEAHVCSMVQQGFGWNVVKL